LSRSIVRSCGWSHRADGDACATGDEGEPHIGAGLTDRACRGNAGKLVVQRRKGGVRIDTKIEGEFPPCSGATGDRGENTLFVRVGRRHRRLRLAEYGADAFERIVNCLAGLGDEILGRAKRPERGGSCLVHNCLGAANLLEFDSRGNLTCANAHEI
jgi:hypothetical protein